MKIHIFTTDISCFHLIPFLKKEHEISCILVPSNRGRSEKVRLVEEQAKKNGIPVRTHRMSQRLDNDLPSADVGICWLYSQIIKGEDLPLYPVGIFNMHGGKIPDYRGSNVLQWAIVNGEKELGVTWHELVEEVDAGPIWMESSVPISDEDTALSVRDAMIGEGIRIFPEAWSRFINKTPGPRIADISKGTVWPRRKPEHGYISADMTEQQVRNIVRALPAPWPSAIVVINGIEKSVLSVSSEAKSKAIAHKTSDNKTIFLHLDDKDE